MKRTIVLAFVICLCMPVTAQVKETIRKILTPSSGLTETDAAAGIREALVKGTTEGVQIVSKLDGYFGNPEIKIPLPPNALAMEAKLRSIGLGKQVDKAILSMNRAAEDAAKRAKPIFVSAIKKMTITDALSIVTGADTAATAYLKAGTYDSLAAQFQPSIEASLKKVNATKYWTDIVTLYNELPFVEKINPDLAGYVTVKAIDGLFLMIAKEELSIRKDPVARTTAILKKVFGKK
ncbi:MAG: DUF4197 domain-containing protein [Acidobacteriota bacterium]